MNFARALLLALVAALLLAPPALAAKGFQLGVTAGEVTSSSAVLWGKANKSGKYSLEVARNGKFKGKTSQSVAAKKGRDNTVQKQVKRLRANTKYWFRFTGKGGKRSDVGTFKTAPKPKQNATIKFALSGDQDFNPEPGKTDAVLEQRRGAGPHEGGAQQLQRDARRHDLLRQRGARPAPADRAEREAEVGQVQDQPGQQEPPGAAPLGRLLLALGRPRVRERLLARRERVRQRRDRERPHALQPRCEGVPRLRAGELEQANGLYRTVRWGRNLEVFFLDQRSFRSANADANHVCDNPQTGSPDVAPTAPQTTRNLFALVTPSLAQPVSQACLDTIRSPNRTYLGKRQLQRFLKDVKSSTARFKVIMNELPIQQYYVLPYDRWEGFEAERQRVLTELQGVKNVIFLTTDVHATLVNDARFQTLESGGAKNSGIMDVTVGPVATANFALEIDRQPGGSGNGALVDTAFLTPPPPAGIGMQCSVLDQFSYGEVTVTGSKLTVTPKDMNGKPQMDGANPCGPFVLNYKP